MPGDSVAPCPEAFMHQVTLALCHRTLRRPPCPEQSRGLASAHLPVGACPLTDIAVRYSPALCRVSQEPCAALSIRGKGTPGGEREAIH